ncbi:3'-5' exonuclease [Desulfonatronum thioautotrophicum]|uniref:3'-5' exonuclease n=1 Tax=Desulfonatronum thioautotrophicum TaxID=617001 RepID=UPI0005EB0B46|nr:3'-5' exonuclease [Desulfonatronum thioautotrophicum]
MFFRRSEQRRRKGEPLPWWDLYAKRLTRVRHPVLRAFYQAGVVDEATAIEDVPMTAMDFETTGLDPAKDTIVSIGVVPFTLRRISSSQGRYWVVNPGGRFREDSVVFHRITHRDVEQCPDLRDVLPEVIQAISRTVVVVHYRQIERRFLDAAARERWGEGIIFPVIDTMDIEARFHRQSLAARWSRFWAHFWGRNERSLRLAASRSRYNLPVYAPHHALTDALATAELFQAQVAWRFSPQTPVSDLWQ